MIFVTFHLVGYNICLHLLFDAIFLNGVFTFWSYAKKSFFKPPQHSKYKTYMCRDMKQKGGCPRGASCTFAHSQEELEKWVLTTTCQRNVCVWESAREREVFFVCVGCGGGFKLVSVPQFSHYYHSGFYTLSIFQKYMCMLFFLISKKNMIS